MSDVAARSPLLTLTTVAMILLAAFILLAGNP